MNRTPPVECWTKVVSNPVTSCHVLKSELEWIQVNNTPRREYYCNTFPEPYTYGSGNGIRTYDPQPWHPIILQIKDTLESKIGVKFDTCFLNRYDSFNDQLGWHADDSPEMDPKRPIAIVSLGQEREIWFKKQGESNDPLNVTKMMLESGSVCLMKEGMQREWFHRIPKHHSQVCETRISLTFRGFVKSATS